MNFSISAQCRHNPAVTVLSVVVFQFAKLSLKEAPLQSRSKRHSYLFFSKIYTSHSKTFTPAIVKNQNPPAKYRDDRAKSRAITGTPQRFECGVNPRHRHSLATHGFHGQGRRRQHSPGKRARDSPGGFTSKTPRRGPVR